MDIDQRIVDSVLVFDIEHDTPLHEPTRRDWFYSEIKEHARQDSPHVIVNLSRLSFIKTIDIGVLIRAAKHLLASHGSMGLVLNLRRRDIFNICTFGLPFGIFDSEEEAFAFFKKHGSFNPTD